MSDQIAAKKMIEQTKALVRIAAALERANTLRLMTLTAEQRQALQAPEPHVRPGGPAALSELGR